jgi:hypothetical protein
MNEVLYIHNVHKVPVCFIAEENQARSTTEFMKLKWKFLKINASVWFNRTCEHKGLITKSRPK